MKKVVAISLFMLVAVCFISQCLASEFSMGIRPEMNLVFKKNLSTKGDDSSKLKLRYQEYSIGVPLSYAKRITITPIIGLAPGERLSDGETTLKYKSGAIYGVKGDLFVIEEYGFKLDLLGEFQYSNLDMKDVVYLGVPISGKAKYSTYNGEIRLSRDLMADRTKLTPYIGLVLSDARLKASFKVLGLSADGKAKAKNNIGMSFGTSAELNDNISATIGGRLIDESSLDVSGTYKF